MSTSDAWDTTRSQVRAAEAVLRSLGATAYADRARELIAKCEQAIAAGRSSDEIDTWLRARLADFASRFEALTPARKATFLEAYEAKLDEGRPAKVPR